MFVVLMGVVFLLILTSCAPGVSREEYDRVVTELTQVTSELNGVKQELEQARQQPLATQGSTQEDFKAIQSQYASLEPLIEIALIRIENERDYQLWKVGKTTQAEYFSQTSKLWTKADTCLTQIGNKEFTQKLTAAWFEPWGQDNDRLWAEANSLHLDLAQQALQVFSEKLGQ
jgi:hypothetical protein